MDALAGDTAPACSEEIQLDRSAGGSIPPLASSNPLKHRSNTTTAQLTTSGTL